MFGMNQNVFLIPMAGGADDRITLTAGLALGKAMGAHLEVCFVRADPGEAILYLGMSGGGREELQEIFKKEVDENGKKAAAKARRQFNAACKELGILKVRHPEAQSNVSARWSEVLGTLTREIPEAAKLADVTIISGSLAKQHLWIPSVLEHAVLDSGHPVLFLPEGSVSFPPEKVAIAWDGTIEAVRAAFAAKPFLQGARSIHILTVKDLYSDASDPKNLEEYLAWHGLNAKSTIIEHDNHNVGQVLLSAATDIGANLLVMGGYSRARLEQVLLGGVTIHAIRKTQIPLLIVH
jgi:nucleotide-binding universal stress UspA family protein